MKSNSYAVLLSIGIAVSMSLAWPAATRAEIRVEGAEANDPGSWTAPLTQTERDLLGRNPVLAHVQQVDPAALRRILERLVELLNRNDAEPPLESFALEDWDILRHNPDLRIAFHGSPEATLELIRLIRTATRRPR